ncbi:hypothetical protein CWS43_16300 [Rahnella sp. AA]|nr:hypothetical protein CWS43_16300 [Rahnella sp. AA]
MGSNTDKATDAWFDNHIDLIVATVSVNWPIEYRFAPFQAKPAALSHRKQTSLKRKLIQFYPNG